MEESNIYFAVNTFNYGGVYDGPTLNKFKLFTGDQAFFRQVMDYDALMKLKNHPKMYGTLNSTYYMASFEQRNKIDPNFSNSSSPMLGRRQEDPIIREENDGYDAEYGYEEKNDYYPLLEEIFIDDEEISYADEMLGRWERADRGIETSDADVYGLYIRQKAVTDNFEGTVRPEEAGFEDIEDRDPYYYIYREAAGRSKKSLGNLDKVKLYEKKYGSIFRAFTEVPQEEIIHAPVNQWSFVNAGPGTGKTYTLMKKITYMVDALCVDPEGILVLCFTNAAVNEIKSRIRQYAEEDRDRSFINVDVRTFHSFSWLLIGQANENFYDRSDYSYIDISRLDYDQSIRKATEIIHKFGDEVFGGCEHLIVDEIQDLTNERAYMVLTMVRECMKNGVGVTILGDSCQAIYDYSDDETLFGLKSDRFYKYMFSDFWGKGELYKLEKNLRQREWLIKITVPLRRAILNGKKEIVRDTIAELKSRVPSLSLHTGSVSAQFSEEDFNQFADGGTLCLLCRNNAQVLATSTNLRKRGIKHIVNAYDEFEHLSGWIGKIFGLYTKDIILFAEFTRRASENNAGISPQKVWDRLQELIGSRNNVLKVSDIIKTVAKSNKEDPIFRNIPIGNLIVSNIHKSKGREYDAVVLERKFVNRLVNESRDIKSVPEYLEEAKVLYVAITRPRKKLYINNLATTDVSLKIIKTGRKRWVRGDGTNLVRIEIRAQTDADINSYNTIDVQEYIINNVAEGDEINLVMDMHSRSAQYNIVHTSNSGERVIGKTSAELIEDIDMIISLYSSPWPRRITDLYVSGVYSKISDKYDQVWCWVDFCGLGIAHTDVY